MSLKGVESCDLIDHSPLSNSQNYWSDMAVSTYKLIQHLKSIIHHYRILLIENIRPTRGADGLRSHQLPNKPMTNLMGYQPVFSNTHFHFHGHIKLDGIFHQLRNMLLHQLQLRFINIKNQFIMHLHDHL